MTEPLDPDTLAEGERLWAALRHLTESEKDEAAAWLYDNAPALLAAARDGVRCTAALHQIADLTDQFGSKMDFDIHSIARAALSADAGDQGTWMGGGLEITYPSAEAGDTDA
jgi:hypothetical protein